MLDFYPSAFNVLVVPPSSKRASIADGGTPSSSTRDDSDLAQIHQLRGASDVVHHPVPYLITPREGMMPIGQTSGALESSELGPDSRCHPRSRDRGAGELWREQAADSKIGYNLYMELLERPFRR